MTRSRQTADWGSRAGLAKIVPSSVAVGSGTGSANSLGTVTFSGASSVSLNGVFSSTYENYRIVASITSSTANEIIYFRVRAAGTDLTTSTYRWAYVRNAYTTSSTASGANPANVIELGAVSSANGKLSLDCYNPQTANETFTPYQWVDNGRVQSGGGMVNNSTSYDSFTLLMVAGNMTGTVSIYGYTN